MLGTESWPASAKELRLVQQALAAAHPPAWHPPAQVYATGGCFVCFGRGAGGRGERGEPGWAGAALAVGPRIVDSAVVRGVAGESYQSGLLALREGPLLEAAVRALPRVPDVLQVDATGRDHPRGAGLAIHLGAVLGLPSVLRSSWVSDRGTDAGSLASGWLQSDRSGRSKLGRSEAISCRGMRIGLEIGVIGDAP